MTGVTAAARWPLVEALLRFLPPVPDVDARAPMHFHLDTMGRVLRKEPGSPTSRRRIRRRHGRTCGTCAGRAYWTCRWRACCGTCG
ncbi:hypothetical protein BXU09_17825 [Deinococcus sp. LM3]|nr:hypothetical protein BXU09_17825 [Deinococcus sp. LM3]